MSKSASIRARVEPELKADAEAILRELGLTTTEAVALFFARIVSERGLPFELKLPNEESMRALEASRTGVGLRKWDSLEEMISHYEK